MKYWWLDLTKSIGRFLSHKIHQTRRLSKKSTDFIFLIIGAALVAAAAWIFARMADWALTKNTAWTQAHPWLAWFVIPVGLMLIVWFTRRFAPFTAGSGIPQVITSLCLPPSSKKTILVDFFPTLLKIPLTFFGMLLGASIGREGPSVQVGAAVMAAWGRWCQRHHLAFSHLQVNDMLAAGAAGGLAAAFNAPLAGVIFAIEELGKGIMLRWDRQIFIGVLAAGFMIVAIDGNNPYFSVFDGKEFAHHMVLWVLGCSLVCGILGGLFARLLLKGPAYISPKKCHTWIKNHPILLAGILGLGLALLGTIYQGQTYGTGYNIATQGLENNTDFTPGLAIAKLGSTILSYWAGIPGGIFTPCLSIGAALGAQISQLTGLTVDGNILVLLCMSAFLAAATQSPLTASVVVMEMTGSASLLFWLLIGALFASIVSRQFCPKPFYHLAAGRFRQRVMQQTNDKIPKYS